MIDLSAGLALLAALCMGFQALSVEHGLTTSEPKPGQSLSFLAAFVTVIVSLVVFWTVLLYRGVPGNISLDSLAPFVIAGVLNPGVFRLLYFDAIDRVGARISATILATYPAMATVIAMVTLGEGITFGVAVGIGAIVTGGVVLQSSRGSGGDGDEDDVDLIVAEIRSASARDLAIPVISAVVLATSYVIVEFGLGRYPHPVMATTTAQSAALVVLFGVMAVRSTYLRHLLALERRPTIAFVLAGLFVAIFWLAQFFALRFGTVVTVIPLVSTFPLVVIAASYVRERELPGSPRIVLGVVAIIAGAILVQTL